MKPQRCIGLIALSLFLFTPAFATQAGEAIEALKGAWQAESFDGEAPPPGMKMVMTFVDDDTLRMDVSFNGESEKEEVKYKATADGKLTIYPEPDEKPEGESATWQIKDKKLHIKTEEGEELVFARQAG